MIKIRKPRRERSSSSVRSRTARPLPEVWQLDVAERTEALCAVMLVDVRAREPLAAEVCVLEDVPARIADVLRSASEQRVARAAAPWPARIEVRNRALAGWLGELGARQGIAIELVERLPQLEAAAARLRGELDARGPRFFVPGLPQALYEAAADLAALAPWQRYSDRNLLVLALEAGADAPPPFPVATLVGGSGLLAGLVLHPSLEACRSWLAGAETAVPAAAEALALWLQEARDVPAIERELFASEGWTREDLYPAFVRLSAGAELVMPDEHEADAMLDALEAVLVFVEDHPQPPAAGTRLTLSFDGGRRVSVSHAPLLEGLDAGSLEPLAPFDVQLFPMALGAEALIAFDAQLDPDKRLAPATVAALPERLRALGLRGRKEDIEALLARLDTLGADTLGFLADTSGARGALVAWAGARPVGQLVACDATFAAELAEAAGSLGGHVIVAFSGGGTRLKAGRVRGRDVLGLRQLRWLAV